MANTRFKFIDGAKSIDLPQYPDSAWTFYSEAPEEKNDFYASVAAVFRAVNLTADATANMPFALCKTTPSGKDYDTSDKWENKVGFMPNPTELIRLWRMSLTMTNTAYGFMENIRGQGKNLRYFVPTTIQPIVTMQEGLTGFKRTLGAASQDYMIDKRGNCPVKYMWRLDHTTELLPSKSTEFKAMMAAAGILYYSDYFTESFYKRGGIKPTMLMVKGVANPQDREKIESIWDKIVRGYYKYLGKVFNADAIEAVPIGDGVDSMKDDALTNSKIQAVAMAMGIPLSLLLANSANYATAQVEYKAWYENSLGPWCKFIASALNDQIFTDMGLRFEFRPEMTDPGKSDEVTSASAYATYCGAGMLPSVAAQIVGIELPENMEYEELDKMAAEKLKAAQDAMIAQNEAKPDAEPDTDQDDKESSSDTEDEKPFPPAKFIPNIDQLHELELWRKFAFRKLKSESLDFPFEIRTLPNDIANNITAELCKALSEDGVKAAFDFGAQSIRKLEEEINSMSKDNAIKELADAINKAVEKPEPRINDTPEEQLGIAMYQVSKSMKLNEDSVKLSEENTAMIMSEIRKISASVSDQQAIINAVRQEIDMNDENTNIIVQAISNLVDRIGNQVPPVIPAPIVNVAAPEITLQPPEVTVNLPKKKPINLSVVRNNDGVITGIQEK